MFHNIRLFTFASFLDEATVQEGGCVQMRADNLEVDWRYKRTQTCEW